MRNKASGNFEAAIIDYQQALTHGATDAQIYLNLGNAQVALKQFDQALNSYSYALANDSTLAEAFNNRGSVYLQMKKAV